MSEVTKGATSQVGEVERLRNALEQIDRINGGADWNGTRTIARTALAATPAADIVIPTDITDHVLSLGRVEWGQTPAHDAEGHAAHVANSVRLTAEYFEQTGDQHMHGLWLAGTETVLCHTGTSPNAPKTTQALVGAWNWLVDQALATTPARNTSQIGEG